MNNELYTMDRIVHYFFAEKKLGTFNGSFIEYMAQYKKKDKGVFEYAPITSASREVRECQSIKQLQRTGL